MYANPPLRYWQTPTPIYDAKRANFRAVRIRRAVAKMYAKYPGRAMDHVNAELDEASRQEVLRQQHLEAQAGA